MQASDSGASFGSHTQGLSQLKNTGLKHLWERNRAPNAFVLLLIANSLLFSFLSLPFCPFQYISIGSKNVPPFPFSAHPYQLLRKADICVRGQFED